MVRLCGLAALLLLIVCAAGCSQSDKPTLALVNGSITKNGQPFADALIEFFPAGKGGASYGTSDASGNFTLHYTTGEPGAALGSHVVKVTGGHIPGSPVKAAPTTKVVQPTTTNEDGEVFTPIGDPSKAATRSAGPPPPVTLTAEVTASSPNLITLVVP